MKDMPRNFPPDQKLPNIKCMMYVCMYVCMYGSMYVCMYVCMERPSRIELGNCTYTTWSPGRAYDKESAKGRVAESVVTLLRRNEPSKDLVSQSLSSKLTCERERWLKRLLISCSQLRTRSRERERERSVHKAIDLLLTAHSSQ